MPSGGRRGWRLVSAASKPKPLLAVRQVLSKAPAPCSRGQAQSSAERNRGKTRGTVDGEQGRAWAGGEHWVGATGEAMGAPWGSEGRGELGSEQGKKVPAGW